MKTAAAIALAVLMMVFCGCSTKYTIDLAPNEARTVPVGSPLFTAYTNGFGFGGTQELVYSGVSYNTIRLTQRSQSYTVSKYGTHYSEPLQSEITFPATFPQDINYQGFRFRVDKADSSGLQFTSYELPPNYQTK